MKGKVFRKKNRDNYKPRVRLSKFVEVKDKENSKLKKNLKIYSKENYVTNQGHFSRLQYTCSSDICSSLFWDICSSISGHQLIKIRTFAHQIPDICSSNFRTFAHQILKSESSALYGQNFHEGLASPFSEEASPEVQP